jgi:WD40 repeat protein
LFGVRVVDPSGLAPPITVPLSSIPTLADFSPSGAQLAMAVGADVVVADTDTGDIAETLHNHDGAITAVEFRPHGDLVTAGEDGAIITSDLGDWSAGFREDMFVRAKTFVVKQPEHTLMLEQPDGLNQLIVAEPAIWEQRACEIAGRVLSEDEWGELLGARPYAPACRE